MNNEVSDKSTPHVEDPPEFAKFKSEIDALSPKQATIAFLLGRAQVCSAQLQQLYPRLRKHGGKNATLPKVEDDESAKKVDYLLAILAKVIGKEPKEKRSNERAMYYGIFLDYRAVMAIVEKVSQLSDVSAAAAANNDDDDEQQPSQPVTPAAPADVSATADAPSPRCQESSTETKQLPPPEMELCDNACTAGDAPTLSPAPESPPQPVEPTAPPPPRRSSRVRKQASRK